MIRPILRLAADNPVLLNLTFAVVIVVGLIAWGRLPKEEFPQVSVDRVGAWVSYPGASPEDIEDLVLRPMERAVEEVEGIEHVYGDATQGVGNMTLEFVRGTDPDAARDEVSRTLSSMPLPDGASDPTIYLARLVVPIVHVGLLGDIRAVDEAERMAEELSGLDGVQEVRIFGAAERTVRVDLDPAELAARGLDAQRVAGAIEAAGVGAPLGQVSQGGQRVLVRSERGLRSVEDVADVTLAAQGGLTLRVGDLGRVYAAWEQPEIPRHVNGQPAIILQLRRSDDADTLKVVDRVEAWVAERADAVPPGLELVAYDDSARAVEDRLRVLASNGLVGLVLVAICLGLFVGRRNALLVIWGMPVAYLGAVAAMWFSGNTVNVISTFALLLVTGIIVDDAVVIVENVQRHLEMGKDRLRASIDGASEVFGAVVASTLTTCLAFAPLMMLEGAVGRVMAIIPEVVIFSLVASLIEAFYILPGHLSHYARERQGETENAPTRALKALYAPLVERVTRRRYAAMVGLAVGFVGVLGLATQMRTTLETEGLPYYVFVNLDLEPSAEVDETRASLREVEGFLWREAGDAVAWIASTSGRQQDPQDFPVTGPQFGQLKIGFHNEPEVFDRVPALLERLRAELGGRPELTAFEIQTIQGGPPAGRPIDIKVRSREADQVPLAARALVEHLESRPGVFDVREGAGQGPEEFQVDVDPARAAAFGLTDGQIIAAVRASLSGALATEIPLGERTAEIRVGLAGLEGADLDAIGDLPVALPGGGVIRLRQVAEVRRDRGLRRIERVDGQRAIRISAMIEQGETTPELEQIALEAEVAELRGELPEIDLFYGGQIADSAESFSQLPAAAGIAVGLIYAVLAVQFLSYLHPPIVLYAIPLELAGVVLGLFVLGMDLSFVAGIGTVGLVGIVVNDSLVLVDFINRARAAGAPAREAVIQASLTRLRPILITTITTVLGLLPLALGLAGEEPLLAPMAVAISFGLSFATALTLVAVPVLYLIVDDLGARLGVGRGSGAVTSQDSIVM